MARYKDIEPIIDFIEKGLNNPDKTKAFGHDAIEILTEIEYAPTADVAEVRHGRWKRVRWVKCDDPDGGYWIVRCNQCSIPHFKEYNFCPSCGARMDGGVTE